MTIKKIRTNLDGTIEGLSVVGFHGRLGANQTPASRATVISDSDGRHVRILSRHNRDALTLIAQQGREREIEVNVAPGPIDEEVWSSTGTRIIPSWTARLGEEFIIISQREIELLDESLIHTGILKFLRWAKCGSISDGDMRCSRIMGTASSNADRFQLIAWLTNYPTIVALRTLIADRIRARLINYRYECFSDLIKISFWLSRAAIHDEDIALSAAGLRLAGSPHWKTILDAGVRESTYNRRVMVDEAMGRLKALKISGII